MKGGFGGSPNDIFDVMQGSIYAYILCMALACRMYYDIYSMTMRSKALRGDPTRRASKAKARIYVFASEEKQSKNDA